MIHCPTCGQELDNKDVYCSLCGSPVIAITLKPIPKAPETDTDEPVSNDPAPPAISDPSAPEPLPYLEASPPAPDTNMVATETAVWAPKPPEESPARKPAATKVQKTKPKKAYTFLNTGLGLMITGALLLAAVCAGLFTPGFFSLQSLENLLRPFGVFALAAIAAAVSTRAKGPDLSIGAVIGTASVVAALFVSHGVALSYATGYTLAIFAAFGLINGMLTAYLKIPALILTFITGLIARAIVLLITNGQMVFASPYLPQALDHTLILIFVAAAFVTAFLLVAITRLGVPTYKREGTGGSMSSMLAYTASAVLSAMAGILLLMRLRLGSAVMGTNDDFFVIFVYAVLISSRALDNRFAPVLFSLVPAALWTLQSSLLPLFYFNTYAQTIIGVGLSLAMLVLAYVCRFKKRDTPKLQTPEPMGEKARKAAPNSTADNPALGARTPQ